MTDWGSIPLAYVAESAIHGQGLFARTPIGAGAYIGCYEGRSTSDNGMHVLWVEGDRPGEWLGFDGTNALRFLNHSARPNAELDGQHLYAIRDIPAGEEITIDYGDEFSEPD